MEENKDRRGVLEPLKHIDDYTEKRIIFHLSWIEIFLNLLLLILFFILLIFYLDNHLFIIIIFAYLLITLLIINIKIDHKNIIEIINEKIIYRVYKKNKNLNNQLIINDSEIFINNEKFNIKEIGFNYKQLTDIENIINQNKNNYQIRFQIISVDDDKYLNEYKNNINNIYINKNNEYLKEHFKEINNFLLNNTKKRHFIIYKDIENIKFLFENELIINFNHDTKQDFHYISKYYELIRNLSLKAKRHKGYLNFDNKFYCALSIYELNDWFIKWLLNILELNLNFTFMISVNNLESNKAIKLLKNNIKIDSFTKQEKSNEIKKDNYIIKKYIKDIKEKEDTLLEVQILMIFNSESLDELKEKITHIKKFFDSIFINTRLISNKLFLINNYYNETKTRYYFGTFINTRQLLIGLYNNDYYDEDKSGFIIGYNEKNFPIFFNQEKFLISKENNYFNGISLILGKSGSGKSILLKKIIYLSNLIMNQKIIIFDVENEYKNLCNHIENNIVLNIENISLDPFKFIFDKLYEKIIFLNSMINCFCKDEFNWTSILLNFFKKESKSSFWKFIEFVKANYNKEYTYLSHIDNVIYHKWFNKEINDLEKYDLIIFNFKSLFDKEILLNNQFILATLTVIFTWISLFIFNNKNYSINLIVDEAHKFFNIKSEILSNIWFSLIKKSRKYKTMITFSTQNYDDLFLNEYAKKILNNVQYLFLGKLNEIEFNYLIENNEFLKNNKKKFLYDLSTLSKGEFLFSCNNHYFMKIKNILDEDVLNKFFIN